MRGALAALVVDIALLLSFVIPTLHSRYFEIALTLSLFASGFLVASFKRAFGIGLLFWFFSLLIWSLTLISLPTIDIIQGRLATPLSTNNLFQFIKAYSFVTYPLETFILSSISGAALGKAIRTIRKQEYASVSGFRRTRSTAAVHPQVLDKLRKTIRQSTPLFERVPHLADVYFDNLSRLANARIINKGPLTPEEMLSILIEAFPSDAELSNRMIDVPDLRRVREDFIHRLAQYFNLSVQDLAEMLADEFNRAHSR